jgi:DNA (cytosine-5)-methyltransferase 1
MSNQCAPVALDLFAGPGGLSDGFVQAGFEIAAQVEKDQTACETLQLRVMFRELKKRGKLREYWKLIRGDISQEDLLKKYPDIADRCAAQVINREFGSKDSTADGPTAIYRLMQDGIEHLKARKAHVLLGGPPCQAFSLAGRSRDPNRMREDERHFLFQYFLFALDRFEPDFFVFENVPGILSAETDRGQTVRMLIEQFNSLKRPYELAMPPHGKLSGLILDSAWFHVPQRRRRIFFIGYRKDLGKKHPEISEVFRRVRALARPDVLTVEDAIGDLPRLRPGEGEDQWWGTYPPASDLKKYQRRMRIGSEGIVHFKARTHMESDLERYKFFIEHHKNGTRQTTLFDLESERPDLMPKHKNTDKFVDRFRVQWLQRPCSTVMSHISKDGHYYIHPDISQCRSFTVREAARCQSFADDFVFRGPRTEQFKQVGNAVPPRLAFVIARVLMSELRKIYGS